MSLHRYLKSTTSAIDFTLSSLAVWSRLRFGSAHVTLKSDRQLTFCEAKLLLSPLSDWSSVRTWPSYGSGRFSHHRHSDLASTSMVLVVIVPSARFGSVISGVPPCMVEHHHRWLHWVETLMNHRHRYQRHNRKIKIESFLAKPSTWSNASSKVKV